MLAAHHSKNGRPKPPTPAALATHLSSGSQVQWQAGQHHRVASTPSLPSLTSGPTSIQSTPRSTPAPTALQNNPDDAPPVPTPHPRQSERARLRGYTDASNLSYYNEHWKTILNSAKDLSRSRLLLVAGFPDPTVAQRDARESINEALAAYRRSNNNLNFTTGQYIYYH